MRSQPKIRVINHVAGRRVLDAPGFADELVANLSRVEKAAAFLRDRARAGKIVPGEVEDINKACRNFIHWAS